MSIYVKNGTPIHGPSLCETCVFVHSKRGYRESELLVLCAATEPFHRVPFPVRECSAYRDKTSSTLYEMERIALIVTPRETKRTGFVHTGEDGEKREIEITLDADA
jgi:hypothetical protein